MKLIFPLIFLLSISMAQGKPTPKVEVFVGGDPSLDACMSQGVMKKETKIKALNKGKIEEVTLIVGLSVFICDEDKDSFGIVFGPDSSVCDVSSPIAKKTKYNGPCKSGWVKKDLVKIIAG